MAGKSTKVVGGVYFSFLLLSLLISLFVFQFSSELVKFLYPELNLKASQASTEYLRVIALTFSLSTMVGFYNAIQVVQGVRVLSLWVPIVNNFAFMLALLIFTDAESFFYVVVAGLLAWMVLVAINSIYSNKLKLPRLEKSWVLFSDSKMRLLFVPVFVACYVEQLSAYVVMYFASEFGEGGVSIVSYANKVNMVLVTLFIVVLNAYIFPKLMSKDKGTQIDKILMISAVRWVLLVSFLVGYILFEYSIEVVELLFLRGGFSVQDALVASSLLSVLAFALPLILLRELLNRVAYALENTLIAFVALVVSVVVQYVVSALLCEMFGLSGVAFSLVVSLLFNIALLIFLLRGQIEISEWKGVLNLSLITIATLFVLHFLMGEVISCLEVSFWILEMVAVSAMYFLVMILLRQQDLIKILRYLGKLNA